MNLWWRFRYVLWMAWWLRGSGIPVGFYWEWSTDEVHNGQHPREAAMDCVYHLKH